MKKQYSRVRVGLVFIFFAACFAVFLARLVWVQVIKGESFREKARDQYLQVIDVTAQRGEIFDCRGSRVATNTSFQSLFAYPVSKSEISRAERQLAYIFDHSRVNFRRAYDLRPGKFSWIERRLSEVELARFKNLEKPAGLYLKEEPTRSYPYGTGGRSIIGFVDVDNRGKSGIELVMNDYLTGHDGRSLIQKDGRGAGYPIREIPLKEARAGRSLVLTVDWNKQQIVEEELRKAIEKNNAKAGMAVFLNPHSGAIIAAADYPPEGEYPGKPTKLCVVCDLFEPGSVFKLITAAAVVEDGRITPEDSFYAGWLTFREGFEVSSNILMGKVANEIGGEKILAMARRFGFGRKTRCGLNGESKGVVDGPHHWSQFTTSTFAIGHGLSVTALQLARAFSVVASGGYLYQPHFIKGCINDEGKVVERHQSRPIKVLGPEIVAVLNNFLGGVVEHGTGQPIADAPFPIAGKTGTAEKANLESGGYYKNRFTASFAGYFPADSPLVAGVVVLDEPEPIHYGGYTAAPAFRDIALKFGAIDNYRSAPLADFRSHPEQIREHIGGDFVKVILPDLSGMSPGKARYELQKLDLVPVFSGNGDRVLTTFPATCARIQPGDKVRCVMSRNSDDSFEIPDLKGMTARDAIMVLDHYRLSFTCRGKGRVSRQKPEAGTLMTEKEKVGLILDGNEGV
jgi:cell division protein FtsI/penicillin-binding protein 2